MSGHSEREVSTTWRFQTLLKWLRPPARRRHSASLCYHASADKVENECVIHYSSNHSNNTNNSSLNKRKEKQNGMVASPPSFSLLHLLLLSPPAHSSLSAAVTSRRRSGRLLQSRCGQRAACCGDRRWLLLSSAAADRPPLSSLPGGQRSQLTLRRDMIKNSLVAVEPSCILGCVGCRRCCSSTCLHLHLHLQMGPVEGASAPSASSELV